MSETHVTFSSCAGWLHIPDGQCRTAAVVLCPPFGAEWLWVYRSYRRLAQSLCAQGFVVLRFDYRGTGDSIGDESMAGGAQEWIESTHAAAEMLKQCAGVQSLAFFGLRLGATIAAAAAATRRDVQSLVLWAPYASGKQFMREARAFSVLRDAPVHSLLSVGGFIIPPALEATLRALTLPEVVPGCRSMLLLQRDDLPSDPALSSQFSEQIADVMLSDVGGYEHMMRDAYDSHTPLDAIAAVTEWMVSRHPELSRPRVTPPSEQPLVDDDFVEESRRFGEQARLFGIVTSPRSAQHRKNRIVILPNVGSNHHIGPARLMVTLARALARDGYTVLRFDVGGLGDSIPANGSVENTLYAAESQQDARAAMNYLDAEFAPDGYVFAGLCSGAYLSFHTAVSDPRVSALILINIVTFRWEPGDTVEAYIQRQFKGTAFYMRAWRDPAVWRRAWQGDVNARGIVASITRRTVARSVTFLTRIVTGNNSDVHRAFKRLAARGATAFLVFGADDAGLDEVERVMRLPARRIAKLPGIELSVVHGADHTFTVPPAREQLIQQVQNFLGELRPVA